MKCLLFFLFLLATGAVRAQTLEKPYVWTDEKAVLRFDAPLAAPLALTVKTITRDGWGPTWSGVAGANESLLGIAPLVEGIHIVEVATTPPREMRFLALRAPSPLNGSEKTALRRALPRNGQKLLSGAPFKILALGDSVTRTGDYETLLVMMLARATGNPNISFVERAHAGKSVDASVRSWQGDAAVKPDLGLLMYGLNDQGANTERAAYLEQTRWLVNRLHQSGADAVLLQPTPDIDFPRDAASTVPPAYALRTLGFGAALREIAPDVPVVDSFDAVWGRGADTLQASIEALRPLYPPIYHRQMNSWIEAGKGDTVHPNALGHLQIARAAFQTLTGSVSPPPMQWRGSSHWTPKGIVSRFVVRNVSDSTRSGRIEVFPPPYAAIFPTGPFPYTLRAGQEMRFDVAWQGAQTPADLARFPHDIYLASGPPFVAALDFSAQGSRAYAAAAPFEPNAAFVRGRQVVTEKALVQLQTNGKTRDFGVKIPRDSPVGRIPLVQRVGNGWAVAELAYVRYGAAREGEAQVDGDLSEWENDAFVPVGEAVQARWTRGPQDFRASSDECFTRWSFRSGKDGVWVAARVTGKVENDTFTLFFDPRSPAELGTTGTFYWLWGSFKADGVLSLKAGETTKTASNLRGAWKATPAGCTLEFFVPYALMNTRGWPLSGDLGLSIWWTHLGEGGRKTHLMWSENGHPWNPRWFGVVRRLAPGDKRELPFMVRVR